MAQNKTQKTDADVGAFLDAVPNPVRRDDGKRVCAMMALVTGETPYMYGPSIVGFGSYRYRYESGREGDAPLVAFSPRGTGLVFYVGGGFPAYEPLLARLGKHKVGKSCLYVNKLTDVDEQALEELVAESAAYARAATPAC